MHFLEFENFLGTVKGLYGDITIDGVAVRGQFKNCTVNVKRLHYFKHWLKRIRNIRASLGTESYGTYLAKNCNGKFHKKKDQQLRNFVDKGLIVRLFVVVFLFVDGGTLLLIHRLKRTKSFRKYFVNCNFLSIHK